MLELYSPMCRNKVPQNLHLVIPLMNWISLKKKQKKIIIYQNNNSRNCDTQIAIEMHNTILLETNNVPRNLSYQIMISEKYN